MVQTILTAVLPLVGSPAGFMVWIVFCALALGAAIPVTFSLTAALVLGALLLTRVGLRPDTPPAHLVVEESADYTRPVHRHPPSG